MGEEVEGQHEAEVAEDGDEVDAEGETEGGGLSYPGGLRRKPHRNMRSTANPDQLRRSQVVAPTA